MLRAKHKLILVIIVVFTLFTCIDPYAPELTGYESLMVIDGLISNANSSCTVKLSKTFQDLNSIPLMVSDATVFITDDNGNVSYLINKSNGIYKTDSTQFRGIIGRTYVLHILTHEEEEYISEPCLMQPVPDIDSIYYIKDQKLVNNGTENQEGISIYLDSKKADNDKYYRWTFEETWKFKVPNPKLFDYIKGYSPDDPLITPVADIKEFCWKQSKSDEILIRTISEGQAQRIMKQPITFIATGKTDRLLIQYSILVKQYSISKNGYEFWNNLSQVNKAGEDIFAKQPYAVVSNIHSTKNPKERVLGFFQVSAVSQKRIYIYYKDVAQMGLPVYTYKCKTWEYRPSDFDPPRPDPPKTWDDVYWYMCIISDYTFIEPKYNGAGSLILSKLVFTRPECANCELSGSHTKPDFWKDIKGK